MYNTVDKVEQPLDIEHPVIGSEESNLSRKNNNLGGSSAISKGKDAVASSLMKILAFKAPPTRSSLPTEKVRKRIMTTS